MGTGWPAKVLGRIVKIKREPALARELEVT